MDRMSEGLPWDTVKRSVGLEMWAPLETFALVPEAEARELFFLKNKKLKFCSICANSEYMEDDPAFICHHCLDEGSERVLLKENARLKSQIAEIEEKCQIYLDATGDAVSALCLRDEKIERLRKALEEISSFESKTNYSNPEARLCAKLCSTVAKEALEDGGEE